MAEYLIQGDTLDAIADAINAKTGGSSAMTPVEMVTAIAAIPGGGGSGYSKKTGSFVLAENYTYNGGPTAAYTGMLIDTGLAAVKAVIIWSEEWQAGTETNGCFGLSLGFDIGFGTIVSTSDILHYYAGSSCMRNGSNNYYSTANQGLFFHSFSNSVPAGSFGIKCYNSSFPIRAGHTIRWEAWGEE